MAMSAAQWTEFHRWPKFLCVDPADRKPWFMAWGAISPRDEYIFYEEWPQHHFWDMPSPDFGGESYAQLIRDIEAGDNSWGVPMQNLFWRIGDPEFFRSPKADTGRSLQEVMLEEGFPFECTVDNDIPSGHLLVRQRLLDGSIVFTPNCNNIRYAFGRYTYDEYRTNPQGLLLKEKPRDEFKDPMDVVRYAVKSDLHYVDLQHSVMRPRLVRNMGLSS